LFVHHSYPGQFQHIVQALAGDGRHDIVFISSQAGSAGITGVHRVGYAVEAASRRTHLDAREFDAAMRRAQAVAEVAAGLQSAGFVPDVIIGHEGWGEMLSLCDVWPGVPQRCYREYFYHMAGADVGCDPEFPVQPGQWAGVRAKNAVGCLGLLQGHPGVSPTRWQRGLYPDWAQPGIAVLPEGVDLAACAPDPAARGRVLPVGPVGIEPGQALVTFAARDLEPYRGFHSFVRALPPLMARPDVQVICLGGDGVSYGLAPPSGTWRQRLMAEVAGRVDPARLHFPGRVDYATYLRVLQRSDLHLYLSYPFIVSWSLREALACGCAVLASDTAPVREFIIPGRTGALVPAFDPAALADAALGLLDNPDQRRGLAVGARDWAVAALAMPDHLARWVAVIVGATGAAPGEVLADQRGHAV
jgi:glycosyltransferase involved in cell wall biosynthesis